MLTITIPAVEESELWNEETLEFITVPYQKAETLNLEHSLISLSKWESKWCKPFFSTKQLSLEEELDYIRCMTVSKPVDKCVYERIDNATKKEIHDYIYAPMTATVIREEKNIRNNKKFITSELIYCWMFTQHIPIECEKWHLNRLMTLIKVCAAENTAPKKYSKQQTAKNYAAINAANRKKFNSKG